MNSFNDMISQAKKMQEKMREIQDNLKNIEVEGVSGGSAVRVILKGDYEMKSILVAPNAKNEKEEIIYDLIIAAHNDAKEKLKKRKLTSIKNIICLLLIKIIN